MKNVTTTRPINSINTTAFALVLSLVLIALAGTPAVQSQEKTIGNIHDAFADIGMKVHGFGGMFVDEDKDTLYVYVVPGQAGDVDELDQAITDVLGSKRPPQRHIRVLAGQYTFLELQDWYSHMRSRVLPMDGVVLTGIDDRKNRLKVGVESSAAAAAVQTELDALGIPRLAVNIVPAGEELPRGLLPTASVLCTGVSTFRQTGEKNAHSVWSPFARGRLASLRPHIVATNLSSLKELFFLNR